MSAFVLAENRVMLLICRLQTKSCKSKCLAHHEEVIKYTQMQHIDLLLRLLISMIMAVVQ